MSEAPRFRAAKALRVSDDDDVCVRVASARRAARAVRAGAAAWRDVVIWQERRRLYYGRCGPRGGGCLFVQRQRTAMSRNHPII